MKKYLTKTILIITLVFSCCGVIAFGADERGNNDSNRSAGGAIGFGMIASASYWAWHIMIVTLKGGRAN